MLSSSTVNPARVDRLHVVVGAALTKVDGVLQDGNRGNEDWVLPRVCTIFGGKSVANASWPADKIGAPADKPGTRTDEVFMPADKTSTHTDKSGRHTEEVFVPSDKTSTHADKPGTHLEEIGRPADKSGTHAD